MPRRIAECGRCGRRNNFQPVDAWTVRDRAPNSLPLTYVRRFCSSCITAAEQWERARVLARREELRRIRRGESTPAGPAAPAAPVVDAQSVVREPITSLVREHLDTRTFGVEIEFTGVTALVEREINAAGEECRYEGYNHERRQGFKIVTDGSIEGPGGELVSPVLSATQGMQRLERACRGLSAARAGVNRSCGLHVHHGTDGMRPRDLYNLLNLYAMNQSRINGMLSPSRRHNSYAMQLDLNAVERWHNDVLYFNRFTPEQMLDTSFFARYISSMARNIGTRYMAVNLLAYDRHTTIEFRQHQGSTNFRRISAWVRFGQALIKYACEHENITRYTTYGQMFTALGLSEEDTEYWFARVGEFSSANVS